MQCFPCVSYLRHPLCPGRLQQVALAFHQQSTNCASFKNTISTGVLSFVPHVETRFTLLRFRTAGLQTIFSYELHQDTPKGLPHPHGPSLTDGCGLLLRAVIPWRDPVDFARDACTLRPYNHPALPNVLSPGCLLTSPVAVPRTLSNNQCSLPRLRVMADVGCYNWQTASRVLSTLCLEHAGASA